MRETRERSSLEAIDLSLVDASTTSKRVKEMETKDEEMNLYSYTADMYQDLFDMITEYMGEAEHISEDNVRIKVSDLPSSVEAMKELRKKLLRKDFIAYWQIAIEEGN